MTSRRTAPADPEAAAATGGGAPRAGARAVRGRLRRAAQLGGVAALRQGAGAPSRLLAQQHAADPRPAPRRDHRRELPALDASSGARCDAGERSLRIWAPSVRRERDESTGEETTSVRAFVLVPVFDVSQTEGPPLPEPPPVAPLSGDSHAHLLAGLERQASEAGYAVERREEMPGQAEGFVDHRAQADRALVGPGAERPGRRARPRAGPRPRRPVPGVRAGRRRGRRRDGGLHRAVGRAPRHARAVGSLRVGMGRRRAEGDRRLRRRGPPNRRVTSSAGLESMHGVRNASSRRAAAISEAIKAPQGLSLRTLSRSNDRRPAITPHSRSAQPRSRGLARSVSIMEGSIAAMRHAGCSPDGCRAAGIVRQRRQDASMRIGTWNLAGRWSLAHQSLLGDAECDVWLLTEVPPAFSLPGGDLSRSEPMTATGRSWAAVWSRGGVGVDPLPLTPWSCPVFVDSRFWESRASDSRRREPCPRDTRPSSAAASWSW